MGSFRCLGLSGLLLAVCSVTVMSAIMVDAEGPEDRSTSSSIETELRQPELFAHYTGCDATTTPDHLDVAAAVDGTVHVVFVGEGQQVLYSRRVAGEASFRAPVRLTAPNSTGFYPQVEVAPNGTVHLVWREQYWTQWAFSSDGGECWTKRSLDHVSAMDGLSLELDPTGMPALLYTSEAIVISHDRMPTTYSMYYYSWDMSGNTLIRQNVYMENNHPILALQLVIGNDGTAHCTYMTWDGPNNTLWWKRSFDGGQTWSGDGPIYKGYDWPFEFRVTAMSGGRLAIAWTSAFAADGSNAPASHVAGRQLSWMIVGTNVTGRYYDRPVNVTTHYSHPYAFDLVSRDETVCVFFLGFHRMWNNKVVTDGPVNLQLFYVRINTTWGSNYPWHASYFSSDYSFNLDGRLEVEYNLTRLAMCLEQGPNPVIVASLVARPWTFGMYAWRVNHSPTAPKGLSETQGGWLIGGTVQLEATEAFDADGDVLWYKMDCWTLDGEPMASPTWNETPSLTLTGLRHGVYIWGINVTDYMGGMNTSEGGWWFRVDTGPPHPGTGGPYLVNEGSVLTLYGGRSHDDGHIIMWEWDWDGDGSFDSSKGEPTFEVVVDLEGRWNATLRVTDEAGLTATDWTLLEVVHVPPTITIDGPDVVHVGNEPATYEAIIEPAWRHAYDCAWYVDGAGPVGGMVLEVAFDEIGQHWLSVRATDEMGRLSCAQLSVTAYWAGPAVVSILGPKEVFVGDAYRVTAFPTCLNHSAVWNFSWYRDGVPLGTARSIDLVAEHAPSERIEVDFMGSDGSTAVAEVVITVREHLRPVDISIATNATMSSIYVEWTRASQIAMFGRYIVRISATPFGGDSEPDLGWMASPGGYAPYVSVDLNDTAHNFTGLQPGTYYYVCVYLEGGGEVAMSEVLTEVTRSIVSHGGGDGDDGPLWVHPTDLVAFIVALVVMVVLVAYRLDKARRDRRN